MKYLYIWRFQPFHLGHLDAIHQAIAKWATHIMIGLGSANTINEDNPWTAQDRESMIRDSLAESWIDQEVYSFELLPDFSTDLERYNYIIDSLPTFDVVMSWNPWVKDIFDSCTHTVFDPEIQSKVNIHATHIREWIRAGEIDKISKYLCPWVLEYVLNTMS